MFCSDASPLEEQCWGERNGGFANHTQQLGVALGGRVRAPPDVASLFLCLSYMTHSPLHTSASPRLASSSLSMRELQST